MPYFDKSITQPASLLQQSLSFGDYSQLASTRRTVDTDTGSPASEISAPEARLRPSESLGQMRPAANQSLRSNCVARADCHPPAAQDKMLQLPPMAHARRLIETSGATASTSNELANPLNVPSDRSETLSDEDEFCAVAMRRYSLALGSCETMSSSSDATLPTLTAASSAARGKHLWRATRSAASSSRAEPTNDSSLARWLSLMLTAVFGIFGQALASLSAGQRLAPPGAFDSQELRAGLKFLALFFAVNFTLSLSYALSSELVARFLS